MSRDPRPLPDLTGPGLQLRRSRPLTGSQAWAVLCCGLLLVAGVLTRSPWIAPAVLVAALVVPGYVVVAGLAAAVEFDSGEGMWRTLALRLIISVAVWTVSGSLLVVADVDPEVAVWLVAAGLVAAGTAGICRRSADLGLPAATSMVDAARTWTAVLGLRRVAASLVAAVVIGAALSGAVAVASSGPAGSDTPFVSLTVGTGAASVTPDRDGRSSIDVGVTGSGLALAEAGRLELRVDGRLRGRAKVTVPAAGSSTVRLAGAWGRCWQRATVTLLPAAGPSAVPTARGPTARGSTGRGTDRHALLPRPLTVVGPGIVSPRAAGCR